MWGIFIRRKANRRALSPKITPSAISRRHPSDSLVRRFTHSFHFRSWHGVILVILLITTVGGYFFFTRGTFAVSEIIIHGIQSSDETAIRTVIDEELWKPSLFIFHPADNIFFVPRQKITKTLLERFPFTSVTVTPILPHTLTITVRERSIQYVLTNPVRDDYYAIDGTGAYIRAMTAPSDPAELIIITDISTPPPVNQVMFSHETITFLDRFNTFRKTTGLGFSISALDLTKAAIHDVTAHTDEPWKLILSLQHDPTIQLLNAMRALQEMKDARATLQYIDVRIPTRIYYK